MNTNEKENKKKLSSKVEEINLKEFMVLDNAKQDETIKNTLNDMWEGNVEVTKNHIEKVLDIAFDNKDNEAYLPESLRVSKQGSKLVFDFHKKTNMGLFLVFLLGFLFLAGFATYTGVQFLGKAELNKDTNGDGVADLNIDLDDDGICDINCDTDKDDIPDRNIDYGGNRKPTFNVLLEDGTIFNKVNQTDDNGVCLLNCDTDKDGHPDTNIDLDGDGIADVNIDVDGDGKPDLNIDTNGDGEPDINVDTDNDGKCDKNCVSISVQSETGELNIDTDGDGICDVNCDTNDDGKPDVNIDYNNNKTPTFNVDDGTGDLKNKTNQDTNRDGICDINCDTNDDGWPDTNIDLDGDGTPDVNVDTNNDGNPDLNIDTNNDGVCDINCDEDGDGKCDKNCAYIIDESGGLLVNGNGETSYETASLIVTFTSGNDISVSNLYPDDQPDDVNKTVPDLTFTIANVTNETIYYNLKWINVSNNFESTNFWYKIASTNSGYTKDWGTVPTSEATITSNVAIAPNTTQEYTVSFTLHGTGEEQNYDQGKTFKGKISVELIQNN